MLLTEHVPVWVCSPQCCS